jgi:hypothetical protein
MIRRSGNPFMHSQHRRQPIRLNSCASRQVLSVLPNETFVFKVSLQTTVEFACRQPLRLAGRHYRQLLGLEEPLGGRSS